MRDASGAYHVRFAETDADVIACQGLRQRCFFGMWVSIMICRRLPPQGSPR